MGKKITSSHLILDHNISVTRYQADEKEDHIKSHDIISQVFTGLNAGTTSRAEFRDRISDFVQSESFSLRHHGSVFVARAHSYFLLISHK